MVQYILTFVLNQQMVTNTSLISCLIPKDLLPFLYSDEEVEKVFSPLPIASYRSARKIKDYIFRSKLYPVERNVGCRGCECSSWQVCENIKVADTFTSFTTKNI